MACRHACKMMFRTRGTPRAWLEKLLGEQRIAAAERVAHELRPLVDALEEAGWCDQVRLVGLACFEVIVRRLNVIVDACKTWLGPFVRERQVLGSAG